MTIFAVHVIIDGISLLWSLKLHTSCWLWSPFGA